MNILKKQMKLFQYMNFSKIKNKEIFNIFSDGLSTEDKVN